MKDLKTLLKEVKKTIPEDTFGTPKEEESEESSAKEALKSKLDGYNHIDDMLKDFSLSAGKQLIFEMYFGKSSNDRRKASESIIHQSIGKPLERVMNVNMEISSYGDEERKSKIKELMNELGYQKSGGSPTQILITGEDEPRQKQTPRVSSTSRVSRRVSKKPKKD